MQPPRAKGISLWLMGEGERQDRLAALIVRLAARLGTEPFAPHLTLLAGLPEREAEVLEQAAGLARALAPLSLRLLGIEGTDEPFRCLFVRVEVSVPLRRAHAAAAHAFRREPDPAFLPHLSLVYGTLPPERQASLARELAPEAAGELETCRLHVWRTQGRTPDWRELAAFPLAAGQGSPTSASETSGGSDR